MRPFQKQNFLIELLKNNVLLVNLPIKRNSFALQKLPGG